MKNSTKKKLAVLLAAVMAAGAAVMPVSATSVDTDTSAGSIVFTAPTNPLVLDKVPSFDFGSQAISPVTTVYSINGTWAGNASTGGSIASTLDVHDMRGAATPAGWKVTVGLTRFSDGTNPSLAGASLKLAKVATPSYLGGGTAPTAPAAANDITLPSDGTTVENYAIAAAGAGAGGWSFTVPDAELTVLGNATVATHTATLNWSLVDAP